MTRSFAIQTSLRQFSVRFKIRSGSFDRNVKNNTFVVSLKFHPKVGEGWFSVKLD